MRLTEYPIWLLITFGSLFIVSAVLPKSWPEKAKVAFRMVVAILFFIVIGAYWLQTGETFVETAYRTVLCPLYQFRRCALLNSLDPTGGLKQAEQEHDHAGRKQRDDALAAQQREALERLQQEADEARTRAKKAEEAKRLRELEEAKARARAAQEEEETRQRQLEEAASRARIARQQELEARRRRKTLEDEIRSHRFGATAIGRNSASRRLVASTFVNQTSMGEAVSNALSECNRRAADCKVIARFGGKGRCVYVAGGQSMRREPGRIAHRMGARAGGTESEALQKCRAVFDRCRIFHSRCNR